MAKQKKDDQVKIQNRSDLYKFYRALRDCPKRGARFSYALAKNFRPVDAEIADMETAIEQTPKMKEYTVKVNELNKKFARLGEEGKRVLLPAIINGEKVQVYDIIGKDIKGSPFEKELGKLTDEYKEHVDAHQKQLDEYNEFMKEEMTWEPFMINFADVPDEAAPWIFNLEYMIRNVKEF